MKLIILLFNSVDEMTIYLQKSADDILKTEIAELAKDTIIENVEKIVYDAAPPGSPTIYQRRGLVYGSGLGAKDSISSKLVSSGVLEVEDDSLPKVPLNDIDLDVLIEKGWGTMDTWYNSPRPFIEQSYFDLEESLAPTFEQALRKRGFTVL